MIDPLAPRTLCDRYSSVYDAWSGPRTMLSVDATTRLPVTSPLKNVTMNISAFRTDASSTRYVGIAGVPRSVLNDPAENSHAHSTGGCHSGLWLGEGVLGIALAGSDEVTNEAFVNVVVGTGGGVGGAVGAAKLTVDINQMISSFAVCSISPFALPTLCTVAGGKCDLVTAKTRQWL